MTLEQQRDFLNLLELLVAVFGLWDPTPIKISDKMKMELLIHKKEYRKDL